MDRFFINLIWHGLFIVQFGKSAMTVIFTTLCFTIVFKIGITLKRYKPKAAFWVFSNNYRNPYATTDNLPETQIKRTNVKTMDRYGCQKISGRVSLQTNSLLSFLFKRIFADFYTDRIIKTRL